MRRTVYFLVSSVWLRQDGSAKSATRLARMSSDLRLTLPKIEALLTLAGFSFTKNDSGKKYEICGN
jgi:hypothetical protein